MRVLYWGAYDAAYVRNRVIIDGLRLNGVDVVECNVPLWSGTADKVRNAGKGWLNPKLPLRMAWAYTRLLVKYVAGGRYDILFVGYAGHIDVFPARVLSWLSRRPLVFDAFLSLHETVVDDRRLVAPDSMLARVLFRIDKVGCAMADLVLLDTQANVEYFADKYDLPRERFLRVWVGADPKYHLIDAVARNEMFTVLYLGGFIPLYGIEHIIRAAWLLRERRDIQFEFIGDGQTCEEMRELAAELELTNIHWGPRWLPPEELAQRIAAADVCLGIFGTSPKARRVIPTKVYVALAMGKPLITEDSPAARELRRDGKDAWLSSPVSPGALSLTIAELLQSPALRDTLSRTPDDLLDDRISLGSIAHDLVQSLAPMVYCTDAARWTCAHISLPPASSAPSNASPPSGTVCNMRIVCPRLDQSGSMRSGPDFAGQVRARISCRVLGDANARREVPSASDHILCKGLAGSAPSHMACEPTAGSPCRGTKRGRRVTVPGHYPGARSALPLLDQ
jgi:glycosyltransferase involved in cell wall biosynthesis